MDIIYIMRDNILLASYILSGIGLVCLIVGIIVFVKTTSFNFPGKGQKFKLGSYDSSKCIATSENKLILKNCSQGTDLEQDYNYDTVTNYVRNIALGKCLDTNNSDYDTTKYATLVNCDSLNNNQKFNYDSKTKEIKNQMSYKCLDYADYNGVKVNNCNNSNTQQFNLL